MMTGAHHDDREGNPRRRLFLGLAGPDPQAPGRDLDPGRLHRQGNDIGTSYPSAIFYLSDAQKQTAEDTIADVNASGLWPGKVVTEVTAAGPFWEAEPEHQDYLEKYPNGYTCHYVRPGWKLPHRADSATS
jgi:peptide-methionine (S)-S-oxide reductase